MDAVKLKEAIDFAIASEAKGVRSQELGLTQSFGQAPFGELVGPTKDRGTLQVSLFEAVISSPNGATRFALTYSQRDKELPCFRRRHGV